MSITKSELKTGILHDQGVKADDMLESALKRVAAHDGAKQALNQFSQSVSDLARLVDRDIDQNLIPVEPLKVAEYVKRYISRAAIQAQAAAKQQENQQMTATGEAVAYQRFVDSIKKEISIEQGKIESAASADEDGNDEDGRRVTGTRPGISIADQRRAEEASDASEPVVATKRKYKKRKVK